MWTKFKFWNFNFNNRFCHPVRARRCRCSGRNGRRNIWNFKRRFLKVFEQISFQNLKFCSKFFTISIFLRLPKFKKIVSGRDRPSPYSQAWSGSCSRAWSGPRKSFAESGSWILRSFHEILRNNPQQHRRQSGHLGPPSWLSQHRSQRRPHRHRRPQKARKQKVWKSHTHSSIIQFWLITPQLKIQNDSFNGFHDQWFIVEQLFDAHLNLRHPILVQWCMFESCTDLNSAQ